MKTFKPISALIAAGTLALIAGPAFASEPLPVPEPGTLSLFAAGVVGVIAVAMIKRKK